MFNKDNLKDIRQDINDALLTVASKYNIDLRLGNISYSENEFSTKLSVSNKDKSYKSSSIGVTIGRTFTKDNKNYVVEDIIPKNRKYPFIIKDTNTGTAYKVSGDYFNKVTFNN